jgi:hypothetical protein
MSGLDCKIIVFFFRLPDKDVEKLEATTAPGEQPVVAPGLLSIRNITASARAIKVSYRQDPDAISHLTANKAYQTPHPRALGIQQV